MVDAGDKARSAGIWLLLIAGGLIAGLTLTPGSGPPVTGCSAHFLSICGDTFGRDFGYNVAAFVPIGIGLALLGVPLVRIGLIGLLASAAIEATQWALLPARDASALDIVANGLGTLLGGAVARHRAGLLRPTPAAARVLAPASAGAIGLLLLFGGFLMGPSYPKAVWYGQWTAELGQFDRFDGRLLAFELNGMPVPSGAIPAASGAPHVERDSGLTVRVRFEDRGRATDRLAPIASIFDSRSRKVLIVGAERGAVVFEPRLRAEDLGLQAIGISFRSRSDGRASDGRAVTARWRGGRMSLEDEGADLQSELWLSPISAWATLLPSPIRGAGALAPVNVALLFLLFFIPGAYAARAAPATGGVGRITALLAIAAAALIGLMAPGLDLPSAPWAEWAAVAAGVLAGIAAGKPTVGAGR